MHGTWWAGAGSLHCFAQQGRRQEGFSTWHPLQLLDGLSEDATRQGQCLILQGHSQGQAGDRVVPSQPGCGSMVLVSTGFDPALELKGRHITCCQPAPTAPEGTGLLMASCKAETPPGSSRPPAAADVGCFFPTFSLGSAERVNKTI